jgi:hypothetical protein
MPDIYGEDYYGGETYVETAPGGAWDAFIGYDPYAPADGYLTTQVNPFDAFGETIEWGGGSDPYQSPTSGAAGSTSDFIRSREAGIPYPSTPINTVPEVEGTSTERGGIESLFKPVVDIFGKSLTIFGGVLASKALERATPSVAGGGERSVPGRPSSSIQYAGAPLGLPARPYVLPSWLGGGTFEASSTNILYLVIAGAVAFFLVALMVKK